MKPLAGLIERLGRGRPPARGDRADGERGPGREVDVAAAGRIAVADRVAVAAVSRSRASPTTRAVSLPGGCFVAVPGLHVDGHAFVGAAVAAGAAVVVVERPLATSDLGPVDPARGRQQPARARHGRRLVVRGSRGHAGRHRRDGHGRQDDDRRDGRGGPRGRGRPDRAREHRRAEDRRRVGAGARPRHDARGARAPAHAPRDRRRRRRRRRRRDDLARARARAGRGDPVRRGDPDEPDPRAPRVPRDLRCLPVRRSARSSSGWARGPRGAAVAPRRGR